MKISYSINNLHSNNNRTQISPTFEHGGKPTTLKYAVQKHSKIIPERVLAEAKKVLSMGNGGTQSLYDIHKRIYAPLLDCKTLDEAKVLFPEFKDMKDEVRYVRETRYSREFFERTDKNFALKMLQEVWANLKTQEEISKSLGMSCNSSLVWPLKQIGFVGYSGNYKTLLKSSDAEGNRIIAAKTTAWNAMHPDLMYKKNKHAAQFCKTPEYKEKQSERMKALYIDYPELAQDKSDFNKEMWSRAPEVRKAMSEFIKNEPSSIRRLFSKKILGEQLSEEESKIIRSVYNRFWNTYPEYKKMLSKACKEAVNSRNSKKR